MNLIAFMLLVGILRTNSNAKMIMSLPVSKFMESKCGIFILKC